MLTVTVDRLVYHACIGVRVVGNDLYLYMWYGYHQYEWNKVGTFQVEVVPDFRQLERMEIPEESVESQCGIGLLAF